MHAHISETYLRFSCCYLYLLSLSVAMPRTCVLQNRRKTLSDCICSVMYILIWGFNQQLNYIHSLQTLDGDRIKLILKCILYF